MAEITDNTLLLSNGQRYTIVRQDGIVTELRLEDLNSFSGSSALSFDPETGLMTTDLFGGQSPWTEVTIREDDADRPWERIETRADQAGEVGYREVVRDNGLNTLVIGSGGDQTVTIRADTDDIRPWSVQQILENANGSKNVLTIFDDDRMRVDFFGSDGRLQVREEFDIGDAHGWAERKTTWDAEGNRDVVEIIRDDGRSVTRDFEDGVLRSVFVEDAEDAFAWATIERTYDETGTLIATDRVMDSDVIQGPPDVPDGGSFFVSPELPALTNDDLAGRYDGVLDGQVPLELNPQPGDFEIG